MTLQRSPERRGTGQEEVRRHNLSAVLEAVHRAGALSRTELAARLGLNRSTILDLVGDLAAAGLLLEEQPRSRTGAGRPSRVVRPVPAVHAVAAAIEVDSLTVAALGLGGTVLCRVRSPHPAGRVTPVGQVVQRIALLSGELAAACGPAARCVGIGVAVAGAVRSSDGLVSFAPNLGWRDEPLGELLRAALPGQLPAGLPVRVGNDADLGALGEATRGVAAGRRDIVYLSGQAGIGGGFIVDGRPVTGAAGYAGEVGHLMVHPGGRRCRCGSRGCWETEVGEDALLLAAGRPAGGGRGAVRQVVRDAAAGDPVARAAVESVGGWIGDGLAGLVNLLNPQMIVLGGVLAEVYPSAVDVVASRLAAGALPGPRERVELVLPALGPDSALHGAAELAFAALLADPLGSLPPDRLPAPGAGPTGGPGTRTGT